MVRHAAGQPALVLFLKLHRIGKLADRVAERADRKLNENLTISRRIIVGKEARAVLPRLDAKPHVVALAAVDMTGFQFGLEKDVAGIEVADPHALGMLHLIHGDPAASVEIEAQAGRSLLGRLFGGRRIGGLWRHCGTGR
jgi:hypothetical protein